MSSRRLLDGPLFDGAVAVVVEPATAARAALAVLGPYVRAADQPTCVSRLADAAGRASLWLVDATSTVDLPAPARTLDVAAVAGRAGGALGVLQCAVAVRWLAGHPGPVVALAGEPAEAVAGLVFAEPPAREEPAA